MNVKKFNLMIVPIGIFFHFKKISQKIIVNRTSIFVKRQFIYN